MTTGHQYNYQDYVPAEGVFCPICQAPCVSLQDLNNHLDREHSEEDSKGALLSWLRNAQKKVSTSLTTKSVPKQWVDLSSNPSFFVSDQQQSEYVAQDHWQRETGNDKCQMPECTKIVGKSGAGSQAVAVAYYQEAVNCKFGFQAVKLTVEEQKKKTADILDYDIACGMLEKIEDNLFQCISLTHNIL
ncbi:hypothetical protein RMATCC62417_17418 [Rhizopus microsporus]|nr:hypothetical protein RMATCC62417_17418 [Rhizopus microsporus]